MNSFYYGSDLILKKVYIALFIITVDREFTVNFCDF